MEYCIYICPITIKPYKMNTPPLKSKTTIKDLLDMVHYTIIKEQKVNNVILEELEAIDKKIESGELKNYEINCPIYWTAVFKDVKENGYNISK